MVDVIDQSLIPRRKLYTGEEIPCIGMGTFGNDRFSAKQVSDAVYGAIKAGYRFFDGASAYRNEDLIGTVYERALKEGIVRRDELFISSKLWNDMHEKGNVLISCATTLKNLRLDYLDLYFVHWPVRNSHPFGASGDSRCPNAKPFNPEEYIETWRQMERLVDMGLVRNLGMSNMTIPKLEAVLPYCRIKPVALEIELHPCFQQPELFKYCIDNKIMPVGYAPIGSPTRPARDNNEGDVSDIQQPEIVEIAKRHGVHPAVICVKWAVQRGQIPIPFSIYENEYVSNLRSVAEDPLSDEEMAVLKKVDKNCRLMKGQVFLWKTAKGWEDLWDPDGVIAK
jgi:alcohol dehydrogenase (NADP+)